MNNDLLKDAVDNLNAEATHIRLSSYENAGDCLDKFLSVLDDEPLKSLLQRVLPEIDFQEWDQNQPNSNEGIGRATFHWPKNLEERVATQLAFFRSGEPQNVIMHLLLDYFYETNFPISYNIFINQFFDPFFLDLSRVINRAIKENTMSDGLSDKSNIRQLSQVDPKKVFVVYGRNEKAREAMFAFLRSIGLDPLEWLHGVSMTSDASPLVPQILETAFNQVQAFVVLLSGDDEARLREPFRKESDEQYENELTPQARPNVLFEAGLAFGTQPHRVVLVEFGKLRPFSDTVGRYTVRINNDINSRQQLAILLRNAGCIVNLDGTDWHTAGNFKSAMANPIESKPIDRIVPEQYDDGYYHFRIQRLITGRGDLALPPKAEFAFNQSKDYFASIARKLYNGQQINIAGETTTGIEINSRVVLSY